MARKIEWLNTVEKTNGNNRYWVSICHITYDHDMLVSVDNGKGEYVREYYRIHYSWKNAKREMSNLTWGATKSFDKAVKMMEKKIKDLEAKIK